MSLRTRKTRVVLLVLVGFASTLLAFRTARPADIDTTDDDRGP